MTVSEPASKFNPDEVLEKQLSEPKSLYADFSKAMSLIHCQEGEAPKEVTPDIFASMTIIEEQALAILEACLNVITSR